MTSKELTKRLLAKSLLCVYATGTLCVSPIWTLSAGAAKKSHAGQSQPQPTATDEALGLDGATVALVNRGDWQGVADTLEKLQTGTTATKADTWLAFAYMYLAKCDQLKAMEKRLGITPVVEAQAPAQSQSSSNLTAQGVADAFGLPKHGDPSTVTPAPAANSAATSSEGTLIQAYDLMCQHKLALAEKTLVPVKDAAARDVPHNYAMAAILCKLERYTQALPYVQATIDAAPDFAWGYRTLGLIYHRFLHDEMKADAAFVKALNIAPHAQEVRDTVIDMRLAKNNFDGAIDEADEAVRLQPHDAGNHFRLAQIYIQQWRLREALAQLQMAISMNPEDARFYRSRASIKRYQGDMDAAISDQRNAVTYAKDKAFELGELASMNLLAGRKKDAIENYQEALKIDPASKPVRDRLIALMYEEKRFDELIALYRNFLSTKKDDPALHLGLAQALEKAGKNDEAIEEYKATANLNPTDPEPHRDLGALWITRRDFSGAAREYTRALNINPSSVPDLVALGYCYAQNDDFQSAEAAFVTSLALQQLTGGNGANGGPTRLQINRSLASLLFEEGRYSDATAQLEAICSTSKGTSEAAMDFLMLTQTKALRDLSNASAQALVDAYNALTPEQKAQSKSAVMETLMNANKLELAMAIANGSASTDPLADLDLAKAYRLKSDFSKAEELASHMVSIKNLNAEQLSDVYEELAQIALAKSELARAEELAKKAIATYPKNYAAYETMGRVYLKQNNSRAALDAANKSIGINIYYTRSYMLLGDIQRATGAMKDAAANYKKAAELYPGLLEAHKSYLQALEKLGMKDEAKREGEQIAQMEKQR